MPQFDRPAAVAAQAGATPLRGRRRPVPASHDDERLTVKPVLAAGGELTTLDDEDTAEVSP